MLNLAVCCVPKEKKLFRNIAAKHQSERSNNYKIKINGFSEIKYFNFCFLTLAFSNFRLKTICIMLTKQINVLLKVIYSTIIVLAE